MAPEEEAPEETMMLQQLKGMGFPEELSSAALRATGSQSTALAAEWILNQQQQQPPPPPPPPQPQQSPSPTHPRRSSIDRYFANNTKKAPPEQQQQSQPQRVPPSTPPPSPPPPPPLYERMRPRSIDEVIGQDHLLPVLRSPVLPSLVLWGPPGTGKTSIARAIASSSRPRLLRFVSLSAVSSGVRDVRDALDEARRRRKKQLTLLFVDEVHRFNRSQLDSFLPAIEDGTVVFVGATTENPSFHLTTPLLSRCRVLPLRPLQPSDIAVLLRRAVSDPDRGLLAPVTVHEDALSLLSTACDGDARVALVALELAAGLALNRVDGPVIVGVDDAREALQCKHLAYDRAGDEHYNLISALHKSMRGGDADAAIYWLARMLEGGEQPLYVARRLVRFASEDVGLADPGALVQAVACYQACHFMGMPECDVNLAQCVVYLSLAPKSVAAYRAIGAAREAVRESAGGNEGVPLHLRNAPTRMMKDLGYGKGYVYPPDHPELPPQPFLPPSLIGRKFLQWPPL